MAVKDIKKVKLVRTERVCRICGKDFKGIGRKCERCSRKSSICEKCGKSTNSRTARICHSCRPSKCVICSKNLNINKTTWSKYCSDTCREKGKNRKVNICLNCSKETETRDQTICRKCRTKKCIKCGSLFTSRSKRIIYCSNKCQMKVKTTQSLKPSLRNISVGNVDMRWCKGHSQYHLSDNFPKNKYYCKKWRSTVDKAKYKEDKKSDDFMQKRRDRYLFLRHGLTPSELFKILESQNFSCLVCGQTDSGKRPWQIDHDHECCPQGKSCQKCRRGILCFKCNSGLGCLKDSAEFLEVAVHMITNFRFKILPGRQIVTRKRKKHSLMSNKNFASSYHLRYAYSVDLEELIKMVGEPVSCSICKNKSPGTMGWNVDHDHECCSGSKSCGRCIRGILCHLCNKGIGLLGDDPILLSSGINYLKNYSNLKDLR